MEASLAPGFLGASPSDHLFRLGVAAIATHEIDAAPAAEWRLLWVLGDLPDATAWPLFLGAHLPLLFVVFTLGEHPRRALREGFRAAVAVFLLIHAGLHFALSGRPEYGFDGWLSAALIGLAAVCGGAWLLVRGAAFRMAPR